jgi:large subunit ribosomal protein L9
MATTEILLVKPVEGLGNEGEQLRVKAGYARNYLFPQKIALPANRANIKQVEALHRARAERESNEIENARELEKKLASLSLAFAVRTGEGGKMFGSVTAGDLLERLEAEGIKLDKKQVNLYTPVKSLGKHTTKVKLHAEVVCEIEFEVVSENPIDEPASEESAGNAS